MEYLHKIRPVERIELKTSEHIDNRPWTDNVNYNGNMFKPPRPLSPHGFADVKLSNGDIHYSVSTHSVFWRECHPNPHVVAYRKANTIRRDKLLKNQILKYHIATTTK